MRWNQIVQRFFIIHQRITASDEQKFSIKCEVHELNNEQKTR